MQYVPLQKICNYTSVLSHCILLLLEVCFAVCVGEDAQLRKK